MIVLPYFLFPDDHTPDIILAQFTATSGSSDSMIYRPQLSADINFIRTQRGNEFWLNRKLSIILTDYCYFEYQ